MGSQILQAIEQLRQLVNDQHRQDLTDCTSNHQQPLPPSSLDVSSPDATPATHQRSERFSEGLDSIFEWRVFHPGLVIRLDEGRPIPMPEELPPITFSELTRFQMNYRRIAQNVNPMLDLRTLDQYVTHISENGFDWTTRTCLVALVCAIGALCQDTSMETPSALGRSDDAEVAYRFWSVACKRLGRAMSHDTVESAQCLCLAG